MFEKDGQKYLIWVNQASGSSAQGWMAEIPSTLTNYNASANVVSKKIRLWNNAVYNQSDPFGSGGTCESFGQIASSSGYLDEHASIPVSYTHLRAHET